MGSLLTQPNISFWATFGSCAWTRIIIFFICVTLPATVLWGVLTATNAGLQIIPNERGRRIAICVGCGITVASAVLGILKFFLKQRADAIARRAREREYGLPVYRNFFHKYLLYM
jgi:hypothetical protein